MQKIGSHSFEEYLDLVRAFHGHSAPGMAIGGFMVDLAQGHLPPGEFFDALCETRACLPDAIQILTPCTIGNGWLKILDFGRFALTLYEKFEGQGVRVFVDPEKVSDWPEISGWFFKTKAREEQNLEALLDEIRRAGSAYCGLEEVRVAPEFLVRHRRKGFAVCPSCREAYPREHGPLCRACRGGSPYGAAPEAGGGGPGFAERKL
ncbi:MAG: formylmethanofuran dehydrogenase subunit E family protein, partial [Proteobacteria bacterium]|nr:formylmethanofuran dehydrogenase subunit E family protein [Pseudomonadota bacterium]